MSNFETQVHKHPYNGWTAKTSISLSGNRQLTVTTWKYSTKRALQTTANVSLIDGSSEVHVLAPGLMGDFRCTYVESHVARVTEKAVRQQHEAFITRAGAVEGVLADVERHYQDQAAAKLSTHVGGVVAAMNQRFQEHGHATAV